MVVQCPQCKTGHLLDEDDLKGLTLLEVQCTKCQTSFTVKAPQIESTSASKAPANQKTNECVTVPGVRTKIPVGKRVSLVVMQGPMKGEIFRLTKPEVTIGRLATDIVVNDPEVSATHCALELRGNYGLLTDMGSTNGTFVSEEQVKRSRLDHLSEFRIGTTTIMFAVTNVE